MRIIGLLIAFTFSTGIYAQSSIFKSLERNVPGEGKVTIHQDESITNLIGAHHTVAAKVDDNNSSVPKSSPKSSTPSSNEGKTVKIESGSQAVILDLDDEEEVVKKTAPKKVIKVTGYRVQVYAGNNTRTAKMEAQKVAYQVSDYFPDVPVYTFFFTPRWLCRVGDFRSMEEAYSMLRKLKATHVFHEVSIVKDRVNVSY
jgi:hypothetical protein